ncbi:MAG: hypothetical protein LBT20_02420 [Clostridiales bacterium]|nr:hypothetical protein [Clostridiales bacterium]
MPKIKKIIITCSFILSVALAGPVLKFFNRTASAGITECTAAAETKPLAATTAEHTAATAATTKPLINVYKSLNDYYIEFFEKNIVKKQVVTQYSEADLKKLAEENGVDFYKMRVMLVVQAIYEKNNTPKELKEIKKMSVGQLTKVIYETKRSFFDSLTAEEKARFDREYREHKSKVES